MAYLVIGGIFMYTQRGARGAEIIPNYSFWKDLPFLVKVNYTLFQSIFFQDGFFFTIRSLLYMNSTKVQNPRRKIHMQALDAGITPYIVSH